MGMNSIPFKDPKWWVERGKIHRWVKQSSSKLLVEKSMHGPSNLDHPPAMELGGKICCFTTEDGIPKRQAIFREDFFLGSAGRIFRNGNRNIIFKITGGRDYLTFQEGIWNSDRFVGFVGGCLFTFHQLPTSQFKLQNKSKESETLTTVSMQMVLDVEWTHSELWQRLTWCVPFMTGLPQSRLFW